MSVQSSLTSPLDKNDTDPKSYNLGAPVLTDEETVEAMKELNVKDFVNKFPRLEKFYADQNMYSFSFQMMAYVSRLKVLRDVLKANQKTDKKTIIITERSLYTDKLVFAKMLYDSGKIEDVNYQIYLNKLYNFGLLLFYY